jgi:hypothetical protein
VDEGNIMDGREEWSLHDVVTHFCNAGRDTSVRSLVGEKVADGYLKRAQRSQLKVIVYRSLFCTSVASGVYLAASLAGLVHWQVATGFVATLICLGALSVALRLSRQRHELTLENMRTLAESDEQRLNIDAVRWLSRNFEAAGLVAVEDVPSHTGADRPLIDGGVFACDNGLLLFLDEGKRAWVRTKSRLPTAPIRVLWHPVRFSDFRPATETTETQTPAAAIVSEPDASYSTRDLIKDMSRMTLDARLSEFMPTVDWEKATKELRAQTYHHALPVMKAHPGAKDDLIAHETHLSMQRSGIAKPPTADVISKLVGKSNHPDYGAFRKFLMAQGLKPGSQPVEDNQPSLFDTSAQTGPAADCQARSANS